MGRRTRRTKTEAMKQNKQPRETCLGTRWSQCTPPRQASLRVDKHEEGGEREPRSPTEEEERDQHQEEETVNSLP